MSAELTDEERKELAEAYHYRYEFEYDQCDHGIGSGGEPYAMCERAFGPESIITATVASIVAAHVRRALEDAADAVEHLPIQKTAAALRLNAAAELRARAAAADPTERSNDG